MIIGLSEEFKSDSCRHLGLQSADQWFYFVKDFVSQSMMM